MFEDALFFGGDVFATDTSFGFSTELTLEATPEVSATPGDITVDFPPILFPPSTLVAQDDVAIVDEDSSTTVSVLENDTAFDPSLLIVTSATNGANGTVALNEDGTIDYTPNADFAGTDTFTYTVFDAFGFAEAIGTVTVVVSPVNDAPVATAIDFGAFAEDGGGQTLNLLTGVTDIDSEPATFSIEAVTVTAVGGTPVTGTAVVSIDEATGTVTLDPELLGDELGEGESAVFEIAYTVLDGDGGSVANTASFEITGVDNGPVIIPGAFVVDTVEDVVDANDGFTSLREALAVTNANDDINVIQFVIDGVIDLQDDLQINSDVRLVGNNATVDAGGRDNIFDVNNGVTVDIENLTLANGDGRDGGAIDGENDVTLNLTNVDFTGNEASNDGGAIAVRNRGEINISGGTFSGNSAEDDGGAISGDNDLILNIDGTTLINNNSGDNGGAISARDRANIEIDGGSLSNNTASDDGGAIIANNDATITLTDVAVDGNVAGDDAGAIQLNDRAVLEINGGSVNGNTADDNGGAFAFDDNGLLDIDGTELQGNSAGRDGGVAFFDDRGTVALSNAVIDGNSTSNEGGAFKFDRDGTVAVENTTISNNSAGDDGGVFALDDNGTVSITGSLLLNNSTTSSVGDGAVIYVDNGNATVTISDTSAIGNSAGDDGSIIATEIDQRGAEFDIRITGDADDVFIDNSAGDDGGVLQVHNNSFIFIDGITIENNSANDDGGVIAVNNNTELFVSTPSEIFNSSNSANDGDFLFSRNDISGEVAGIAFDGDFIIF